MDDPELPSGRLLALEGESRSQSDPHSPAYSESQSNQEDNHVGPTNLKSVLRAPSITSECSQSFQEGVGFRAAEAYIRPSPIVTNGLVANHVFDLRSCTFTMSLAGRGHEMGQDIATEIYLPDFHFPDTHTVVSVSSGEWTIDHAQIDSVKVQRLRWWHAAGEQDIKIEGVKRKPGDLTDVSGEDLTYLEQCQRGGCTVM